MSSTLTYTQSFNAQWIISAPVNETPVWVTTNTNYWIGDATLPNGIQPFYNLDFGFFNQSASVNLDLGGIL